MANKFAIMPSVRYTRQILPWPTAMKEIAALPRFCWRAAVSSGRAPMAAPKKNNKTCNYVKFPPPFGRWESNITSVLSLFFVPSPSASAATIKSQGFTLAFDAGRDPPRPLNGRAAARCAAAWPCHSTPATWPHDARPNCSPRHFGRAAARCAAARPSPARCPLCRPFGRVRYASAADLARPLRGRASAPAPRPRAALLRLTTAYQRGAFGMSRHK